MRDDGPLTQLSQAQQQVAEASSPLPPEWVRVEDAVGRALAQEVCALRTLPPWDNSAMDGYAVRSGDAVLAHATLKVVETVYAGQLPRRTLQPGEAARIMTGAPLPRGADAVVRQERTRAVGETVELLEPAQAGDFVRPRGEDAREGEVLLPRGSSLGVPEAALLWAQGLTQVLVPRRPRVALLSTGDELCRVDEAPNGRIVDTNSPALALSVARAGGIPTVLGSARDEREEVKALFERALDFDVVISSAGVSVGERDFVREALEPLGMKLRFWRVAIKPGKPVLFGTCGRTLVFGLPGNPASSLVTFELFVRPALRALQGHLWALPLPCSGRSAVRLKKPQGLAHFLRSTVEWRQGALWATPLPTQTSGALRSAARATHLAVLPAEVTSVEPGDPIELLPVSWAG